MTDLLMACPTFFQRVFSRIAAQEEVVAILEVTGEGPNPEPSFELRLRKASLPAWQQACEVSVSAGLPGLRLPPGMPKD